MKSATGRVWAVGGRTTPRDTPRMKATPPTLGTFTPLATEGTQNRDKALNSALEIRLIQWSTRAVMVHF